MANNGCNYVVVLGLMLVVAMSGVVAAAAAKPLKPCMWYDSDNTTSYVGGGCGTNDAFTLQIKASDVGNSAIGKAFVSNIKMNTICEKTLNDEAGCLAQSKAKPETQCVFGLDGICQSSTYAVLVAIACHGSIAKEYYTCLTHLDTASCAKDSNCQWLPEVSKGNLDPESLSCYHKTVPTDLSKFNSWFADNIGNAEPKVYKKFWGTCATAKQNMARTAYTVACKSTMDQDTCLAKTCIWNPNPMAKDLCRPDGARAYALWLEGAGTLKDQFLQCMSPTLTYIMGKDACNSYTLV